MCLLILMCKSILSNYVVRQFDTLCTLIISIDLYEKKQFKLNICYEVLNETVNIHLWKKLTCDLYTLCYSFTIKINKYMG